MNDGGYKRYHVELRLDSPMIMGTGMDAQNHRLTQRHIPGAVIRGSLGAKLYGERGKFYSPINAYSSTGARARPEDPDLDQVFGEDGVRFGPLYPVFSNGDSDHDSQGEPWGRVFDSIVIPQTTFTCKANPGLWDRSRGEHTTVDFAFSAIYGESRPSKCKCDGRLERIRGYATIHSSARNAWEKANPRVFMRMRVGLNRQSATAEEGILHSMQLVEPCRFMGFWSMTGKQHEILMNALAPFKDGDGFEVSIGAGRSRGLGQGVLYIADSPEVSAPAAFPKVEGETRYFIITARSPLLVLDDSGISRTVLFPEIIRRYYPDSPEFALLKDGCYAEGELASGWSGMWGLPKPVCNCISAGSVFLYRSCAPEEKLKSFFEVIMNRGLGERLAEGFGQVDVNHRFHSDFRPGRENNGR